MLLVISPNLAIDRIVEVENFRAGKVQRARSVITQPGGKGINAARVFRQLGGEVFVLGFCGTRNRSWVHRPLSAMGIESNAIAGYAGYTRVCTVILNPGLDAHPTVINEESGVVSRD